MKINVNLLIKFIIINSLLKFVQLDRFCQISEQEKCGESLKSGKCDLISLDKYSFLGQYDFNLIPISEYKKDILTTFNNERENINFDIYRRKRDLAKNRNYPQHSKIFAAVRMIHYHI